MEIKCPTCGYIVKENKEMRCPRCYTSLLEFFKCTGSCKKCNLKKGCNK